MAIYCQRPWIFFLLLCFHSKRKDKFYPYCVWLFFFLKTYILFCSVEMEETSATGCVDLAVVLSTPGLNKCNLCWKCNTAWGCHCPRERNHWKEQGFCCRDAASMFFLQSTACAMRWNSRGNPSLPILPWILNLEPAWTDFPLYVLEPFLLLVISPLPGGRGSKSTADLWPSVSLGQPDTLEPLVSPRKHGRVIYWVL